MDDTADQAGFAVVYPQSLVNYAGVTQWDYFYYPWWSGPEPDDTAFLGQLIDTLQATLRPDPKRIFATGHSAGSFMSHRAAVELSSRIAAIASVSGTIYGKASTDRRVVPPARGPVSVLILHGDVDTSVPYCGVTPEDFLYASQDVSFNYWAANNGCTTFDTMALLCTYSIASPVSEKRATGCLANTEVRIYKLIGGVHTWYSQPLNDPNNLPYNPNFDSTVGITMNDIIWNFFATHPKP
jgi:polyhydroxybutyrate depolymerase